MALAVAVIVVERKRDAIPPREERARPEARGGHELEQLLEDAPYRPDVDRAVVRLLQDHLRRTVPSCGNIVCQCTLNSNPIMPNDKEWRDADIPRQIIVTVEMMVSNRYKVTISFDG